MTSPLIIYIYLWSYLPVYYNKWHYYGLIPGEGGVAPKRKLRTTFYAQLFINFLLYVLDVISAGVGSHPPIDNELLRQHDCEGDAEAFTP